MCVLRLVKRPFATACYVADPQASVVFVIGKASRIGSRQLNIELSRDRARSIMRYIAEQIPLSFHHIHGAWVGRDILQFDESDARTLNLAPDDYRQDDLVLNQAVHVFVYPCMGSMDHH